MSSVLTGIVIMLARMIDVSLNTIKTKALIRGNKGLVMIIGAVELLVYTLAASQAFKYVNDPVILLLYTLGYSLGYYIGMTIDEKFNKSIVQATVITECKGWAIADKLRDSGFGVTTNRGYGLNGARKEQLTVVLEKERELEFINIVKTLDEKAYVFVLDVKSIGMVNTGK